MMQRYRLTVPQGVGPGQEFVCNVGGQQMRVRCPAGCGPGSQIEIQAPAPQQVTPQQFQPPQQQHYQQQQQQLAPPPPPAAPGQSPLGAPVNIKALGNQCTASQQAEQQLGQHQGSPSPALIFTAMDRDGGGSIDVGELQYGLSQGNRFPFSEKTCRLLIHMHDSDRSGKVEIKDFHKLWGFVDQWRAVYDAHDTDRSGSISKAELKDSIEKVGYHFSASFYEKLMKVYDKNNTGEIGFDYFIRLFCELHMLTEAFKKFDVQRNGSATFKYEEFIDATYQLHP